MLRALQAAPHLSIQELADRINLSHTPCWRRLKRLETEGVIHGRAVLLNAAALNLPITVFAEIKLKQHDEETLGNLESAVERCPEIVECFSMSGDRDYIFRVVMQSVEQYEQFLKKYCCTCQALLRSTPALRLSA